MYIQVPVVNEKVLRKFFARFKFEETLHLLINLPIAHFAAAPTLAVSLYQRTADCSSIFGWSYMGMFARKR